MHAAEAPILHQSESITAWGSPPGFIMCLENSVMCMANTSHTSGTRKMATSPKTDALNISRDAPRRHMPNPFSQKCPAPENIVIATSMAAAGYANHQYMAAMLLSVSWYPILKSSAFIASISPSAFVSAS